MTPLIRKPTLKSAIGAITATPPQVAPPTAPAPVPTKAAAAQLQAMQAPAKTNPATSSGRPSMSVPAPKPSLPTPTQQIAPGLPGGEDPAVAGSRVMAQQNAMNPATPTPMPTQPPSAPTVTENPEAPNADAQLAALRKSYLGTFDVSPEERAAQEKLDAITARQEMLRANAQAGEQNVAEQPIAFSLIGGQQAAIQRQLAARLGQEAAQAVPLTAQLARIQAQQQARQRMTEAELGFATSDQQRADTLAKEQAAARKPIEVGGVLVDPVTFQPVYTPPSEPRDFLEVSEGATLVDPVTGDPVYTAPKTYKTTSGGGGGGIVLPDGGPVDPVVESWTQNILNGRATLANVPAAIKNAVSAEVNRQSAGTQRLSSAQASEIADIDTLSSLVSQVQSFGSDGKIEGVGPVSGSLGAIGSKLFGTGSEEAKAVRSLTGNIRATIAKLRAGTSFTANEEKLLDTYTPKDTDSQNLIISKLNGLNQFLTTRKNAIVQSAQGTTRGVQVGGQGGGSSDPLGIR